jgi:hypothetical protein
LTDGAWGHLIENTENLTAWYEPCTSSEDEAQGKPAKPCIAGVDMPGVGRMPCSDCTNPPPHGAECIQPHLTSGVLPVEPGNELKSLRNLLRAELTDQALKMARKLAKLNIIVRRHGFHASLFHPSAGLRYISAPTSCRLRVLLSANYPFETVPFLSSRLGIRRLPTPKCSTVCWRNGVSSAVGQGGFQLGETEAPYPPCASAQRMARYGTSAGEVHQIAR